MIYVCPILVNLLCAKGGIPTCHLVCITSVHGARGCPGSAALPRFAEFETVPDDTSTHVFFRWVVISSANLDRPHRDLSRCLGLRRGGDGPGSERAGRRPDATARSAGYVTPYCTYSSESHSITLYYTILCYTMILHTILYSTII